MKKFLLIPVGVLLIIGDSLFAQAVVQATSGAVITVQTGTSFNTNGGINLAANSTLKNAGTVILNKTAAGTADFTDNTIAAYSYGIGKFVFTGQGQQGLGSINQFERIDVNNSGLNLFSNIKANTWYLKSGAVATGLFFAEATSAAANAIQADITNTNYTNSWINGSLRRYITPSTVDNYIFPVGNASNVYIAEMDNLLANPLTGVSNVAASFGPKPGNDVGLNAAELGTTYSAMNSGGVWYLSPDLNPTGGVYDLKLYFNNFTGLNDNRFGILRRPDASSVASEWIVPVGSVLPNAGSMGRIVSGGYARRNNISTFSQYGIATSLAALPLDLLNFYAVRKNKNVLLQWTTANETNTSHFELYRGSQPTALQYLGQVAATGSSSTNQTYGFTDLNPLNGLNFYRLKIVDKDNSYKMSGFEKINFDDNASINIYPNPVINNMLFVDYSGEKIKDIRLVAVDGKQLTCNFTMQNNNQLKVSVPSTIAKGTYLLQLYTDDGVKNATVIIQ